MFDNEVKVSICCATYNQEKYLRKTLDGFLSQRTNFKYEIVINDDGSTDKTQKIIKEYVDKYGEIFHPIYQTENQWSKGKKIFWGILYPKTLGKYIALCEGDDYWCDPYKLQKQYDILENKQKISVCVHKVQGIYENGEKTEEYFPSHCIPNGIIEEKEFVKQQVGEGQYLFQTSSYFFRRDIISPYIINRPDFIENAKVGDYPLLLFLLNKGDLYFLNDCMSCYRMNSIGSWNSKFKTESKRVQNLLNNIETYKSYNAFTNYKYNDIVEEGICKAEFYILLHQKNYYGLFALKYRNILKQISYKEKIYFIIAEKSKLFLKIYSYLKRKREK